MSTRRSFLKMAALASGGALVLPRLAWPFAQSPTRIRKFIVPLQGLGPTGIPVATPDTKSFPGEDYYQIHVGEFSQMMHPDLPGPTKFWGYADVTNGQAPNHRYLGGVIVAQKGRPVRLKAINQLPPVHPLPVDTTIHGRRTRTEPYLCSPARGTGSVDVRRRTFRMVLAYEQWHQFLEWNRSAGRSGLSLPE